MNLYVSFLVCIAVSLGAETTNSDADGWSLSSLILSNSHKTTLGLTVTSSLSLSIPLHHDLFSHFAIFIDVLKNNSALLFIVVQ